MGYFTFDPTLLTIKQTTTHAYPIIISIPENRHRWLEWKDGALFTGGNIPISEAASVLARELATCPIFREDPDFRGEVLRIDDSQNCLGRYVELRRDQHWGSVLTYVVTMHAVLPPDTEAFLKETAVQFDRCIAQQRVSADENAG